MQIVNFTLAVLITEALTELLVKSEFFKPLRKWFFDRRENRAFNFVHDLLDCGYCTSVWVGFFTSVVLVNINVVHPCIDWFVVWLAVHRLSNILHFIIDRVKGELA